MSLVRGPPQRNANVLARPFLPTRVRLCQAGFTFHASSEEARLPLAHVGTIRLQTPYLTTRVPPCQVELTLRASSGEGRRIRQLLWDVSSEPLCL
eukprot:4354944-Pyramimonas_sp.AAC.1